MDVVDPFEKTTGREKHIIPTHVVDMYGKTIQRTAELEKYFQINHCNSTEERSSHGTLIEEKESGCNSVEEDFDENFRHVDDLGAHGKTFYSYQVTINLEALLKLCKSTHKNHLDV